MMALTRNLAPTTASMVFSETMYDLNENESRMPDVSLILDETARRPAPD